MSEDKALCARVAALLAAHDQPHGLLTALAEGIASTMKIESAEEPVDETIGQRIGRYKILEKVDDGNAEWLCGRANRAGAAPRPAQIIKLV